MAENERDTHFLGFAKLLFDELSALYLNKGLELMLGDPTREVEQQEITLIAQRAYDLVYHACSKLGNAEYALRYWPGEQVIDEYIPDLTEWPDTTPQEIPDEPRHWPTPEEPS